MVSPSHTSDSLTAGASTGQSATSVSDTALSQGLFGKVLQSIGSHPSEGVQFSLYGVKGMPQEGIDSLSAENLTVVEQKLEQHYLAPDQHGRLAIIFREGLSFEFVSPVEAQFYREDRSLQEAAGPIKPLDLPELRSDRVRAALDNTVIIGGRASQREADTIAHLLGINTYERDIKNFANTETHVRLPETIRGKNVVIVQAFPGNVDIGLASTRFLLDAVSRASARSITLTAPFLPYLRGDRRGDTRTSISAASMFAELMAASRGKLGTIVTLDMHSAQAEGMTGCINLDGLSGSALLIKPLKEYLNGREFSIIDADTGAGKRNEETGLYRKLWMACEGRVEHAGVMQKLRGKQLNSIETMKFVGDPSLVRGKTIVMFEDMSDTGGTLIRSMEEVHKMEPAEIIFCATHPIFSMGAVERLRAATVETPAGVRPAINKVLVCNTVPLRRGRGELIQTVDVYPMLAHFVAGVVSDGGFSTRHLAELYSGTNGNGH